jgi:restriction system protein
MPIPDFQSLMLPLLELAADGREHSLSEARDALAERLGVSEVKRAELFPSGRQAVYDSRVAYLQRSRFDLAPCDSGRAGGKTGNTQGR